MGLVKIFLFKTFGPEPYLRESGGFFGAIFGQEVSFKEKFFF